MKHFGLQRTHALIAFAMLAIIAFTLAARAVAQSELPEAALDPAQWFANPLALAALVFAAVAAIKTHVLTGLSGLATVAMSFILAIGISIVGSLVGTFEASLVEAVTYGVGAALLASGGWDGIKALLAGAIGRKS